MTLLVGTPEERLNLHIDPHCCQQVTGICQVTESAKDGRATIHCRLRAEDRGCKWEIGHPVGFAGLKIRASADGVIVVRHADAVTTAHIIECKRTAHAYKLDTDIKPQFIGSLLRLLALTGLAPLDIDDAVFYIAFRNDTTPEDTVYSKLPIGDEVPAKQREQYRQLLEWRGEQPLTLTGIASNTFTLRRIPLTANPADPGEGIADVLLEPRAR